MALSAVTRAKVLTQVRLCFHCAITHFINNNQRPFLRHLGRKSDASIESGVFPLDASISRTSISVLVLQYVRLTTAITNLQQFTLYAPGHATAGISPLCSKNM